MTRMFRLLNEEASSLSKGNWMPTVDFLENKKEVNITVDLPGVAKESLNVSLEEGRKHNKLGIAGKRECLPDPDESTLSAYYERPCGDFLRSISLPREADGNSIKASFANGILSINIPKKEVPEHAPKKIPISL